MLWDKGDIEELLKEGRVIQRSIRGSKLARNPNDDAKLARKFSNLMMEGKVRAMLQLLTKETESWPLKLNDVAEDSGKTVRDILKDKHPPPEPPYPDVFLNNDVADSDFHPVIFESITAEVIRKSAILSQDSAGPSSMDALTWRRLCTAFGEKSNELCSAIAAFAKRICTTYVDPSSLMAYTSCRLVPLDKCPGVRPIGIGEVVRRKVGKAVMKVVKRNIQEAICSIQLCAGQDTGCVAAVHAIEHLYAEDDMEAMILVDASNAFNRLNRQVTLLNCDKICPDMAHIFINTYHKKSYLLVDCQRLLSEEGTTQGHPLAMEMYAIGTLPLIHRLYGIAEQVWYADDSTAASSLENLRQWWDTINEIGLLYGYFPNHTKLHILVKPQHIVKAKEVFKGTAVMITEEGERYLGSAMGITSFVEQFVQRKVEGWINEIKKLSMFAVTQPHAAFAAFTHGLVSRWNYLLRVIDWDILSSIDLLQPLETVIQCQFIPAVTSHTPPGKQMRELLALPVRLGGLGLQNPVTITEKQHTASKLICTPLVDRIVKQVHNLGECHVLQQKTKLGSVLTDVTSKKKRQRIFKNKYHLLFNTISRERSIYSAYLITN